MFSIVKAKDSETVKDGFNSALDAYKYLYRDLCQKDQKGVYNGEYVVNGPDEMLKEEEENLEPFVGMPATICGFSDRSPATIVRVSASKKTVWVKEDNSKVVKGSSHDGSAEYEYEPSNGALETQFRLRSNGAWVRVGESTKSGAKLVIGSRRRYYDPHF